VNLVTTRFGVVQVTDDQLIRVPEGLVGFRSLTSYALIPDPVVAGLTWLQSTTDPETAFALVTPEQVVTEYKLDLRPGDKAALELTNGDDAVVYVILNRGETGGLTVNLQGPLVINPHRRLGRQIVLTSSRYAVRYPLGSSASVAQPASSQDSDSSEPVEAAAAGLIDVVARVSL